jgi:hypothetical protein
VIRVVDKSTGEILTFEYDGMDDLARQYDEVTQQINALERAKKKMADELKFMMADEKQIRLVTAGHLNG